MTAIVAVAENGKVYMGGDSAGSNSHMIQTRIDEKVFIKGKFIFGGCGSFRMLQILKWSFKPPRHKAGMSDEEYMMTVFLNAVKKAFAIEGYGKILPGVDNSHRSEFLVGYKGKIYCIQGDYQVAISEDNFYAIGSGDDTCYGSLFSTKKKPVETRLKLALAAAEKRNVGVRRPFVIKCLEK